MGTEILLIRHGVTEWNKLGKFQGKADIPLSDEGRSQAMALKESLHGEFQAVYASPLVRAMETARILCQDTNQQVIPCEGMKEIDFGAWEGLTLDEIKNTYPKEFAAWRSDEKEGPFIGGDISIRNASIRASEAIRRVAENHPEDKILIIAHGGIIKAGLIGLFEWKMTMYHHFYLGNTAISKVSFRNSNYPILESFNDTNHLN